MDLGRSGNTVIGRELSGAIAIALALVQEEISGGPRDITAE
jgi:hypothetical protein